MLRCFEDWELFQSSEYPLESAIKATLQQKTKHTVVSCLIFTSIKKLNVDRSHLGTILPISQPILGPHSSLWLWQHQVVPLTDRPRLTSSTSLNLFTWPPPAPAPVAVWPQNLGPRAGLWPESEPGVETEGCESLTPHWATGGFTYNLSTFVNYGYTKNSYVFYDMCMTIFKRKKPHFLLCQC